MKLLAILSLLLLPFVLKSQEEYLNLPWSSLGACEMEWVDRGEEKNTWSIVLNGQDTIYYTAYHQLINFSAEQVMKRIAKSIQPNYYLARFTVMANVNGDQKGEIEHALFAIESKEYIPTGKPLTTIYLVTMGEQKSYIVSVDLPTYKLKTKDKKKWKSFFQQASLNSGEIEKMMVQLN